MEWETAPVSASKVEPEEDPLGGDISPSRDVTVPSPENVTVQSVPTPQTAPGIQIVNLDNLLQTPNEKENRKTEPKTHQSLSETVPSSPINVNQLHNALVSATGLQVEDEPEGMLMTYEPTETSIEDELSELLQFNRPVSKNQAAQPIALPDDHLAAISPNIISVPTLKSAHLLPMVPNTTNSTISRTTNVLSSAQTVSSGNEPVAGSNMVLLLTTCGRLVASSILPNAGGQSSGSTKFRHKRVQRPGVQSPGFNSSKTKSQFDPIGHAQVGSPSAPRTSIDSKPSSVNILNAAKISDTLKLTRNPNKPTQHLYMGKIIGANAPKVPPPVTSNSSLWPPPGWVKKKPKPKIELPLSGSWTNPNPPSVPSREEVHDETEQNTMDLMQPETDPLAGPVQDIIPYPSQLANSKNDLTIGTFVNVESYASSQREAPRICSTATQCELELPNPGLSQDVAAKYDPSELKRPLLRPVSRGVGISVQSKLILYNILKYFQQRKAYYKLRYTTTEVVESATGVKVCTLRKVMREAKMCCNVKDPLSIPTFRQPSKRRSRLKTYISNMHIDTALRRYIHEYFLKKKESPGLTFLKSVCHRNGWKSGYMKVNFIRLRIKKLGFVSVRTNRRMIHIEGAPIRAWRYKYLKQMKTCVENKKNIVFTFVLHLREFKQSEWQVLECFDEVKWQSRVLTVFHAANENGFIDGAFFINDTDVDPDSADEAVFQKCYFEWLELHLLKKLPEGSVVVLAHSKYHELTDCKLKPNAGCSKKEVVDWLRSHVVGDVDETLPKCVLLEEVDKFPVKQRYTIDSLVETYGHTPVHLPPSQRDLNPIEYVWEDFRGKASVNEKLKTVKGALAGEFSSAEPKLKNTWMQVRKCEETYRMNDPLLEDAQEAAIRKLGGMWNPPGIGPLPDETDGDLDVNLNSRDSDSSDSDSSGQSEKSKRQSTSGSDSGTNSESDSEEDDSDESDSSESSSSDSKDPQDDAHFSERVNSNKKRKVE